MFLTAESWDFVRLCYLRNNKCERDSSLSPVAEKHNWIIKICHAAKPDVAFGEVYINFAKVGIKDSMRHPAGFGAVQRPAKVRMRKLAQNINRQVILP